MPSAEHHFGHEGSWSATDSAATWLTCSWTTRTARSTISGSSRTRCHPGDHPHIPVCALIGRRRSAPAKGRTPELVTCRWARTRSRCRPGGA